MVRHFSILALASLAALSLGLSSGCAPHPTYGQVSVGHDHGRVDIAFTSRDRALITDWYRRHLPPGLAKQGKIPPGHRKRLARRGHLPPRTGGHRLPSDLEARLSDLPRGYVRLRVGTDIVLMNASTRLVVDIVKDIGR